ncbi:DUF192 domain-containing protein [Qipengyuania spongiae]|uniref:DUF192 domain-containing protein n=1 Tax=Qipengyuania spongiae TaxID=2909673 RepID=A0ABY5T1S9_9SPHN|nr:DUF192 domain-containing protein [Qipengyuania spongiae]UVI40370.1 DUF192 domain-containing protein [Qipengyuania spongiae]
MRTAFAAILALALAACSAQSAGDVAATEQGGPSRHSVSGLEIVPLTIRSENTEHRFRVEIARTAQEQARGLMFRTELGANEGMIFPGGSPEPRSFWMKNTPLPLDILFIAADRRIRNIASDTVPYSTQQVPSVGAVIAVLELPGGRAAELGIEEGDLVAW